MKALAILTALALATIIIGALLLSGLLLTTGQRAPSKTPLAKQSLWMLSTLGNDSATHMLASMRLFQSDDPREMKKGLEVIKKEAEFGSCYSTGKLGWAYQRGLAVNKDLDKALALYEEAAKCGMTYWQILLSHAHEEGYFGFKPDPEEAAYWRKMEPKIHIANYDCWVADYYRDGTFQYDEDKLLLHESRCEN